MKSLLALLVPLLLSTVCCGQDTGVLSTKDSKGITERAMAWYAQDDWGQPEKKYGHPALANESRHRGTRFKGVRLLLVTVIQTSEVRSRFVYNTTSGELSKDNEPSNPERNSNSLMKVYVHIAPAKEGGWRVGVTGVTENNLTYYIHVIQQDAKFVVGSFDWISEF